jgi:hypothetical protein
MENLAAERAPQPKKIKISVETVRTPATASVPNLEVDQKDD